MKNPYTTPISPRPDKAGPVPDPAKRVEEVPEAADYRSDWNNDDQKIPPKTPPSTREQPV